MIPYHLIIIGISVSLFQSDLIIFKKGVWLKHFDWVESIDALNKFDENKVRMKAWVYCRKEFIVLFKMLVQFVSPRSHCLQFFNHINHFVITLFILWLEILNHFEKQFMCFVEIVLALIVIPLIIKWSFIHYFTELF